MFTVEYGGSRLHIETSARRVQVDGVDVALTPTEYEILSLLAERAGNLVSLDDIVSAIWGDWYGQRGHVSVHIHHLRRKLGPCGSLIVTRRSLGYLLDAGQASVASGHEFSGEFLELLERDASLRSIVWVVGHFDRSIAWISSSVTKVLGWQPGDLVGKYPWEIFDETSPDGALDDAPLTDGDIATRRAVAEDGRRVLIEVAIHVLRDAQGSYLASWRVRDAGVPDASARSVVTLVYDAESTLISVDSEEPFLGWDPERIVGTFHSLAGLDAEGSRNLFMAMIASGRLSSGGRFAVHRADGSVVDALVSLRLDAPDGTLTGYTVTVILPP